MESSESIVVAFLGPLGTYSHQVTGDYFGFNVILSPQERIIDVFEAVTSLKALYGLVPIENSSIGSVLETQIALRETICSVRDMVSLPIGHALLGREEVDLSRIKRVYSHEQGIGQCVGYLKRMYPAAEVVPCNSTAKAAQLAKNDVESLAICSIKCAEVYGLKVVDQNIQDGGIGNTTRFCVISLPHNPLAKEFPIASQK